MKSSANGCGVLQSFPTLPAVSIGSVATVPSPGRRSTFDNSDLKTMHAPSSLPQLLAPISASVSPAHRIGGRTASSRRLSLSPMLPDGLTNIADTMSMAHFSPLRRGGSIGPAAGAAGAGSANAVGAPSLRSASRDSTGSLTSDETKSKSQLSSMASMRHLLVDTPMSSRESLGYFPVLTLPESIPGSPVSQSGASSPRERDQDVCGGIYLPEPHADHRIALQAAHLLQLQLDKASPRNRLLPPLHLEPLPMPGASGISPPVATATSPVAAAAASSPHAPLRLPPKFLRSKTATSVPTILELEA